MKVESIAECSKRAFCNIFDLHQAIIRLENQYLVFFLSGRLRQVLLYLFQGIRGTKVKFLGEQGNKDNIGGQGT